MRDKLAPDAMTALASTTGDRFAVPTTGPGRSLALEATGAVVDDAWAMSGGTYLWRRGMTFDGSFAVSVFDERLTDGRPAEVAAFRRALVSGLSGAVPAEIATEVPSWSRLGDVSPTDRPRPVTPWNPCA